MGSIFNVRIATEKRNHREEDERGNFWIHGEVLFMIIEVYSYPY
jgi:hypothetical protein